MRPSRRLRAAVLAAVWALLTCAAAGAAEAPASPPASSVERLARLARLWGAVRYLHPYLAYKEIDWDAALLRAIPRVRTASSREEYAAAVREMLAALGDPATHLMEDEPAGGGIPTVPGHPLMRWEQDVLIVDVPRFDDSGPDVQKQMNEAGEALVKARAVVVELRLMPPWTEVSYFLDGLGAGRFTCRPVQAPAQRYLQHSGYRSQFGPSGYSSSFVTETAERFEPPPGCTPKRVAFVMGPTTGVPEIALALQASGGTAWPIAPRLNVRNAREAASFCRMQVSAPRFGGMERTRFCFFQPLPPAQGSKYAGPTVMLIDERTISQAEHTGLFFETANGTRFVGTPSAGANGDITYFTVPGGIRIRFTGHDVRHADGRQLQRVGLHPDVEAAPTIQGIREGCDEVLERAVRDLEERLASTSK